MCVCVCVCDIIVVRPTTSVMSIIAGVHVVVSRLPSFCPDVRTRLYRVPSIGKYTRTVYCVLGRMARSVNSTRTYYRVMMITRGDLEYEIPNNEA